MEADVIAVLTQVLNCEADPNTSRENTLQWDSLKHIEIVFALEEALEIELSEKEMESLDSVQTILRVLNHRHAT